MKKLLKRLSKAADEARDRVSGYSKNEKDALLKTAHQIMRRKKK